MKVRFLALSTLPLMMHAAPGLAQRVDWPPPQISAPLVTPTVAHEFVTGYTSLGSTLSQAQPAFTDISGSLSVAQCPAGTTGAIGCLEVGGGLSVSAGIVQMNPVTVTSHQWFSSVSSGGVLTSTQPAASDLSNGTTGSGAVALATSPTFLTSATVNSNVTSFPALSAQLNVGNTDGNGAKIAILSSASQSVINMYRGDNTYLAPSALLNGDGIAALQFHGWNGSAYSGSTASIHATATENWNGSANGTVIGIIATPTGSVTAETEALFQSGVVVGASGTAQGIGTVNAVSGYWVGSNNVVTSSSAGVFAGGLTTPTVNKVTITQPASAATLTIANGVTTTFNANFTNAGPLSTTGTGATTLAFPSSTSTYTFPTTSGGDKLAGLGFANTFTQTQTVNSNVTSFPALSAQLNVGNTDGTGAKVAILSSASQSVINLYRGNNTYLSPSALLNGDGIATLQFHGWNGSAYSGAMASIHATATENWDGSDNGTVVAITATPTGSVTAETEALFQSGVVVGASGTAHGIGTMNAVSGYWVGSNNVVTSSSGGVFAGGLTATISSATSALNYACYNVSTGVFTYDGSSTCLVSSLRFKHNVVPIRGALATVMAFDPIEFTYNDESNIKGRQAGLSAESVAAANPILATFDDQGRPEKVKYMEVIGVLTAAVQEQQHEIDDLRAAAHH